MPLDYSNQTCRMWQSTAFVAAGAVGTLMATVAPSPHRSPLLILRPVDCCNWDRCTALLPVPAGTSKPAAHQLAGAAAPPAATTEPQAALPPRHPPIGDRSCAIMCTSGAGGQRGPRCQLGARTRRGRLPQRAQMPAPARPQHQFALTRTRSAHLHSSSQPPHRPTARSCSRPPPCAQPSPCCSSARPAWPAPTGSP